MMLAMQPFRLATPTPPLGIACPFCGATKHSIISTMKVPGAVKRTRRCTNGHLFPTMEKV